jgi:hypothetical protein
VCFSIGVLAPPVVISVAFRDFHALKNTVDCHPSASMAVIISPQTPAGVSQTDASESLRDPQ